MRYMLDTNIVSYYLRRTSATLELRLTEALRQQECGISVLTRAELRYGQACMAPDDRRRGLIDLFLRQVPHLGWTSRAADHYGQIKATHRRLSTPIGELDTQIAAHAMAEGLVLITHNVKRFERVAGLVIEAWAQELP